MSSGEVHRPSTLALEQIPEEAWPFAHRVPHYWGLGTVDAPYNGGWRIAKDVTAHNRPLQKKLKALGFVSVGGTWLRPDHPHPDAVSRSESK